ncbi:MAG TPA: CBS domain-containing protein [Chloroflexi bacterium]|jgi:Zn-dependent protease|nr:CBS domain-containing protein [Chloroflexota bacterium]
MAARGGLRIGRLFGITLQIDFSWLFILVLVTWNLAFVFGQFHPEWGAGVQWGLALVAALLFFASVLAHELAHSLVAKARGVPVRNITLFLFGGVSNIQREPDTPQHEFVMAIVGPLTSLVVGGLLLVLAGVLAGPIAAAPTDPGNVIGQLSPITTMVYWLGSINVVLGLFNLTPAFPLDGGRVLRSILWAATDNLRRATRWASWISQGIAWLMIVAGIAMVFGVTIPFFGTGLVGGLWLAFIGWFLSNAASQSYRQVVINDMLDDVPVAQIMRRDPPVCSADVVVSTMVQECIMGTDDYGFPVVDAAGTLVGMVTLQDVRGVARREWETTPVRQIMTPMDKLIIVHSGEDASEALNQLLQRDIRQLPVMDDGHLVGMVRRRDIIRWLQLAPGERGREGEWRED